MRLSRGPARTRPTGDETTWVKVEDSRQAERRIGAAVIDRNCANCNAVLRIRRGPQALFLGCPNYRSCGAAPVWAWPERKLLPNGAEVVDGDVVFRRDEMGEPV